MEKMLIKDTENTSNLAYTMGLVRDIFCKNFRLCLFTV